MAAIILDFDGTIADSFDYVVGFLERHVRKNRPVTAEEKAILRGMSMIDMATYLGCPRWKLPYLFISGRRAMGRAIYNVPLFEGMGRVIDRLHSEGHTLIIVSSNNSRNIKKFLHQHHLYKFFTDIYGGAGFFGKRRAIRAVLWRNRLQAKHAIYVGDEARDIDASRAAGVRIVSVAWGFDQADILATRSPDAIAHQPLELTMILEDM